MPYQPKYYKVTNPQNAMFGQVGMFLHRVGGFYTGTYRLRFPDGHTADIFSGALELSDQETYKKQQSK